MSGGGGGNGGGGGGGGVSKLATALIIIFAISLLALLVELFYVLCRRRVFRRRANPVPGGGDEASQISSSESSLSSFTASKDQLLYFLCVRPAPQFRIERNSAAANTAAGDLDSDQQSEMEVIDIDLLKLHGMFGPPRFLFTIKEEEKEDLESPVEKSLPRPGCRKEGERKIGDGRVCRVSLEEHFKAAAAEEKAMEIDDATPFSTPCASPSYFTPADSPVHEAVDSRSPEEGLVTSAQKDAVLEVRNVNL